MKVIACIPVRYGSTRLPGKPLIAIDGEPLILHVARRARRAQHCDELVILTDDDRIARVVTDAGFHAVMTSEDCASGSDRIVDYIKQRHPGDVFVNIQGDELLIDPDHIDALITQFNPENLVATLAHQVQDPLLLNNPTTAKIVTNLAGKAMYFSRQCIPLQQHGGLPSQSLLHIGIYIYTREAICQFANWPQTPLEKIEKLEQLRFLEHGVPIQIVEVSKAQSLSIDTVKDLEKAHEYFAEA